MEIIFNEIIKILLSKNILFVIPILGLWVFVTWFSRNKVERVFLPKSIALLQRIFTEIVVFILLTFLASIPLNLRVDYIAETNTLSIFLYISTILLSLFALALNNNFKRWRENKYISHPLSLFLLFLLMSLSSLFLYSYLVQISALGVEESIQSNVISSRDILVYLILNNPLLNTLTYILTFSAIFYVPLRLSFGVIILEFWKWNQNLNSPLITVVLKNGKKIEGVYMKNNAPSSYLHLRNKDELPSQYIVINREEIEYLLFTDSNHNFEENIKIQDSNTEGNSENNVTRV